MSPLEAAAGLALLLIAGRLGQIVRRLNVLVRDTAALRRLHEARDLREQQLFGAADARETLRR